MSTFTFLHEIGEYVYAIRDCTNGISDGIRRGVVIGYQGTATEGSHNSPNVYTMRYTVRFDGDTFTTNLNVPFNVLSQRYLTEGLTHLNFDQLSGSPLSADTTEGTFTGGSGYQVGDTITLQDGSVVTVDAISSTPAGSPIGSPVTLLGDVTEFTVTTNSQATVDVGDTLNQLTTSGNGVNFALTVGNANTTFDGYSVIETVTGTTVFATKQDAINQYMTTLP